MGICLFVLFQTYLDKIMLINGQAFDGTFVYEYADGQLKNVCANNISCIYEFTPVRLANARMIYRFLHSLLRYHLCCFVSGTYVLYTSGCLDAFDGITLYIAMTDVPLLSYIFRNFTIQISCWMSFRSVWYIKRNMMFGITW